ncbi:MAG: hypothetical protein LC687_07625 [Actinobacteria bacterium]|nr:hypothetical protein [Actinomycetota bacterium]
MNKIFRYSLAVFFGMGVGSRVTAQLVAGLIKNGRMQEIIDKHRENHATSRLG